MNNAGPFLTLRLFDWWSREGSNLYDISISTNALSQLSYSPQFDLIIESVGMNKIFSKITRAFSDPWRFQTRKSYGTENQNYAETDDSDQLPVFQECTHLFG